MLQLKNDHLVVEILDPRSDQDYFGTRYCTGGYIFQITDTRIGPLLAGPTYPGSYNVFDGQGIPDSFNLAPLRGADNVHALVPGVGLCDLAGNTVIEPCAWDLEQRKRSVTFRTRHVFQRWGVELKRKVTLDGRTVRSETSVRNTGTERFPHPFFPHLPAATDELIKLNIPVILPENKGYRLSHSGYIHRKGWPWAEGHYQALDIARSTELVIIQRHPSLGQISASCDYAPTYFPIWGNANTFSWEPMLERTIAPAQEAAWQIDYDF